MKSIRTIAIGMAACLPLATMALSQDNGGQKAQDCKAPAIQQSPGGNKGGVQDPDITGSTKLSGCEGVITPPETGDSTLVQPAPPSSNMPVVKPKDLPSQQQNAK